MNTGGPSQAGQRLDARAGVSRGLVYAATGIAPHGSTNRAAYTVPAGSHALLESASCDITTDAAVTTAGINLVRVRTTPDSGGAHAAMGLGLGAQTVVGSQNSQTSGLGIQLNAGNVVDILTEDASTLGSKRYEISADIYEFVS